MAEYLAGQSMVLTWTYSGGTVSLAADYRQCNWTPTTSYVDATAGSDTTMSRIPTFIDATADIEMVNPSGGTALYAALAARTAGTLTIQPEGTAVGERKITFPCYCDGANYAHPYADVATLTCGFTGSNILGDFTDAANT